MELGGVRSALARFSKKAVPEMSLVSRMIGMLAEGVCEAEAIAAGGAEAMRVVAGSDVAFLHARADQYATGGRVQIRRRAARTTAETTKGVFADGTRRDGTYLTEQESWCERGRARRGESLELVSLLLLLRRESEADGGCASKGGRCDAREQETAEQQTGQQTSISAVRCASVRGIWERESRPAQRE